MLGTILNICIYVYSHVILRKSQSGKDDNCPYIAEENEAWRGEQGSQQSELGQIILPKLRRQLCLVPIPTVPAAVSGAPFSLTSHSTLPEACAHSCRKRHYAWAWLCKRCTVDRAALANLRLQVADEECNFFAPDNWAPPERNPLRMPTESLLMRANKLPALILFLLAHPFLSKTNSISVPRNSLLTEGT